ncbi:MAG: primosomal protein N' [Candidatus Moranbacteria bacterium]|nr:primosomal protein N' [Candidatus Moranbacteria bacterium]
MNKNDKNFIIDIIPLTRIPLSRQQYFSYEFSRELPAGTLVTIPLFRRFVQGIVAVSRSDFHRLGNIRLKKVEKIIEEKSLTPEQLELAQFISDYYICPLGVVLKFFVPKRTKARKKYNVSSIMYNVLPKIILTREQEEAVKEISKKNTLYKIHDTKYLLFGPAGSGKTEVYIHSILKLREKNKKCQFLVLVPELMLTSQAIERYGAHLRAEEIAILHSKISKGEFYRQWQRIKMGEAKLIIGTRMAVFAPFKNLKLIIIDEEQDVSFKQWDMSPRYDARKAAEKLAQIHQAKVLLGSATPSIESYYKALNKEYELLKLSGLQITDYRLQEPNIEIIDMKKERWIKNYSPISRVLKSEIEYALKNKLQTILFVNRQGMSSFSICANCRTVLRCARCDRALVYSADGTYRCLHCSNKTGVFAACSSCKGMAFRNIGFGTQKVEQEIKRYFPGARVRRADFETMKKLKEIKDLYREFTNEKIDILIGTQMITKGWNSPQIGLTGIIDADNLLSLPDFRAGERAFQSIVQLAGRVRRPAGSSPGKVIIQTYNPENPIIKSAAKMDLEGFYQKEIEERISLQYPPMARFIKIAFQNTSQKKVEKEAEKAYYDLKGLENIIVSEPQNPLVPRRREKFRKQIIIKIKNHSKEIPPALLKMLKKLGSGWIIDVDPISIV